MRRALLALLLLPAAAVALPDVTRPGPYAVGSTTVAFTKASETTGAARPLPTLVWYPTSGDGGEGTVSPDAPVRRGRWPLVLFSHGVCSIPDQSLFFVTALASYGFVVAAPPHPGGEFTDGYPACLTTLADSFANRVADIRFVLDGMLAEARNSSSPFYRRLDPRRIGMTGHSFGGQTAIRVAAADPRVRAVVALAPALQVLVKDLRVATPTMIIDAERDSLASIRSDGQPYFDQLDGPRELVEILNAGHFAFSDVCVGGSVIPLAPDDCAPGLLGQPEGHALTLRHAIPFLMRYLAGRRAFSVLLRPSSAPAGAPVIAARRMRR